MPNIVNKAPTIDDQSTHLKNLIDWLQELSNDELDTVMQNILNLKNQRAVATVEITHNQLAKKVWRELIETIKLFNIPGMDWRNGDHFKDVWFKWVKPDKLYYTIMRSIENWNKDTVDNMISLIKSNNELNKLLVSDYKNVKSFVETIREKGKIIWYKGKMTDMVRVETPLSIFFASYLQMLSNETLKKLSEDHSFSKVSDYIRDRIVAEKLSRI